MTQKLKQIQENMLSGSRAVMVYSEPRHLDQASVNDDVVMSVCGFSSIIAAVLGSEPGAVSLGPATEGDSLLLRRGVHVLHHPVVIDKGITVKRERSYAGGGGGGYSGGGGGGSGCGSGGGGGSFVCAQAWHVRIESGVNLKGEGIQVVGNNTHGSITLRDPILGDVWRFNYRGCVEEWYCPRRSTFAITVKGAAAADAGTQKGGTGAIIEAYLRLEEGDSLIMLIGGMSEVYSDQWGGCSGGGGGTFLFLNELRTSSLLVAAGGGGGAAHARFSVGMAGQHASVNEQGSPGTGAFSGKGGQLGLAGASRPITSCFASTEPNSPFSNHPKLKALAACGREDFPGGGSGLYKCAPGASPTVVGLHFADAHIPPPTSPVAASASPASVPAVPAESAFSSHAAATSSPAALPATDAALNGLARGGFGGGGCANCHPEEVVLRWVDTHAALIFRGGSPTLAGLRLEHSGHPM